MNEYRLWMFCISSESDMMNHLMTKNSSSAQETAIKLIGIDIMIFGLILTPLVSSSKNLNNPALDAGNGAFFFLSAISYSKI